MRSKADIAVAIMKNANMVLLRLLSKLMLARITEILLENFKIRLRPAIITGNIPEKINTKLTSITMSIRNNTININDGIFVDPNKGIITMNSEKIMNIDVPM